MQPETAGSPLSRPMTISYSTLEGSSTHSTADTAMPAASMTPRVRSPPLRSARLDGRAQQVAELSRGSPRSHHRAGVVGELLEA